jgi:threonine synthase
MRYVSTRAKEGDKSSVPLSAAIEQGLASDGGLFVPERMPIRRPKDLQDELARVAGSLPGLATRLLAPFFENDALAAHLAQIAAEALSFPTPLKHLTSDTAVLELFHGPTAAFKDVGARFLAGCFARIPTPDVGHRRARRTILVATSGDTGGAVAAAFHGQPGTDVVILFPDGGVSPLQQKQLTCWQGNVRSLRVRGTFDDCQRLVKAAFAARGAEADDPVFGPRGGRHLTSANSINIGRLLPQMAYYAQASLSYRSMTGEAPGIVVPSGNVGNALAAAWAMRLGLPVRELVLATNANRVVPDYFASGKFAPAASRRTLANAMDVGNPSNLERLIRLLDEGMQDEGATGDGLRGRIRAVSVSDAEISRAIEQGPERYGEVWCPHTAAAVHARGLESSAHWIVVATAHPAKFGEVVEPLLARVGARPAPMPPQLEQLLERESNLVDIGPGLDELREALRA